MTRNEILTQIGQYFSANELVCNHTYERWGEASWQFLDTTFLHCLLVIREQILKAPMICNSSAAHQRGLRCNMCELVKSKNSVYLSAHLMGKAGDFTVSGMTAEEARQKVLANADLLPCNIRMEQGVTWFHFDVMQQWGVEDKIRLFNG